MNAAPTLALPLVHEDAALLAVAKPEGLATIAERDLGVPCLHRLLEAQRSERLWIVHRLDKEVSGLVLFARHADAHRALSVAFERRDVKKSYRVAVHGQLAADEGTIDRPIVQFGSGRMGVDDRRGKPSRTTYRALRRAPRFTLADAHPLTGRRHQIRVHFYSLGHPLVGDPRYGDLAQQAKFPRLMLHAHRLDVPHPAGGRLQLEAPPPPSFDEALASLGLAP